MAFIIKYSNKRWPNGIVPYEIDPAFTVGSPERNAILNAIAHWEQNTRIRFVYITNESDFLYFVDDPRRCRTPVGRKGGRQNVTCTLLPGGGFNTRSVIHEIGHAVGFYHEHQRPDRNGRVEVAAGSDPINYQILTDGITIGDYDCNSIMHYPSMPGTLTSISCPAAMGTNIGLGNGEVVAVDVMYGAFAQETPIATISRNPDQMDIFGIGRDGFAYSTWWNGNPWRNWFRVGSLVFPQNTPIATICRNPEQMDIFAVADDQRVYSVWWSGNPWREWFRIGSRELPRFPQNTPIATICRNPEQMDIFAVADDQRVYSVWWSGNPWREWFRIGSRELPRFPQNTPIATICRNPNQMDIFAVGEDGGVYSAWWNGNPWREWFRIGSRVFRRNTPIATICRNPNQMDIFAVGEDGRVYSAGWNGDWQDWNLLDSTFGASAAASGADTIGTAQQLLSLSQQLAGNFPTEAVNAAQAAIDVLRPFQPPDSERAAYLNLLGECLWYLIPRLIEAQRVNEILAPAQECIQVYRQAAASGAEVTGIANNLRTLSHSWLAGNFPTEAVNAAQAAIDVLRPFQPSVAERASYLNLLAESLWYLVPRLIEAQCVNEILAPAQECIQVYRQAAAAGAEVTSIANKLRTLSHSWLAGNFPTEAVNAAQAAIDVLRPFQPPAAERASYLNLLAESLWHLVPRLIEAQRINEVSAPAQECIQVYRQAAASGAEVTGIANNLRTLSSWLASVGLTAEAEAAADAAADILP
jgi:hypothetical protein